MKKLLLFILAISGIVFSQTYYNDLGRSEDRTRVTRVIEKEAIAEFVVDVALDSAEIGYSRVYDIKNLPLVVVESSSQSITSTRGDSSTLQADSVTVFSGTVTSTNTVTASVTQSLDGGDLMYSVYDVDGTAGDSVNIQIITQVSVYGANGNDPFKTYSDGWTTLHTDTVAGASASGALVETTRDLTFSNESARFLRWKITNLSGDTSDDDARVRVYWQRKKRI